MWCVKQIVGSDGYEPLEYIKMKSAFLHKQVVLVDYDTKEEITVDISDIDKYKPIMGYHCKGIKCTVCCIDKFSYMLSQCIEPVMEVTELPLVFDFCTISLTERSNHRKLPRTHDICLFSFEDTEISQVDEFGLIFKIRYLSFGSDTGYLALLYILEFLEKYSPFDIFAYDELIMGYSIYYRVKFSNLIKAKRLFTKRKVLTSK